MNRPQHGEAGFSAQDNRPYGIQGTPEEADRIDALEARLREAGLDLFGSPLDPEAVAS
jgi:hypothetical protein